MSCLQFAVRVNCKSYSNSFCLHSFMDDPAFHQKRIDVLFTVPVDILVPDLQFGIQTLFYLFS